MERALAALLITAVTTAPALAQTDTRPAFAVATIKRNTSGDAAQSLRLQPGGRIVAINQTPRRLIVFAYGLQPQQLAGAPAWVDSDRFDIVAQADGNLSPTPPGGPPGPAQLMLQRLLVERFGLVVHTEARETPVYALTLAQSDRRLGPRITAADRDCVALMTTAPGGVPIAAPQLPDGRPACGARSDASGRIIAGGIGMTMLAQMFSGRLDRLVVDRTGLLGAYDFDLEYEPDATTAVTDRASLFTAVEEQLGLKLQPARVPIDVTIIDRITPPTAN